VHQRVTGPNVKFHERQELLTLWYTVYIPYISSEFTVQMLEEASCAELTVANCALHRTRARKLRYVVSKNPLWTSYFSLMSLCKS